MPRGKQTVCWKWPIIFPLLFFIQAAIADDRFACTSNITEQSLEQISQYWTEEKLKQAKPLPNPVIGPKDLEILTREIDSAAEEIKGVYPNAIVARSSNVNVTPAGQGKAVPGNVEDNPYWHAGRLMFEKVDDHDYTCTAQFVGSEKVLLTAAHCVQDVSTGEWNRNFIFYRSYNDDNEGQVAGVLSVAVPKGWYEQTGEANYQYDYAFIYTADNSEIGWMGLETGNPFKSWTAIGYAENHENNSILYQIKGNRGEEKNELTEVAIQMQGNTLGAGSGGGAWIGDLNPATLTHRP